MIYEWKLDGETRNYGDALYEVIVPAGKLKEYREDENNMHFLIGSVIVNKVIEETLNLGYTPVFHGCGWRGEELDPELVKYCQFEGVRGPHTQKELERIGVETYVSGDPAYILPSIVKAGRPNGFALCIRHIMDKTETVPNTVHELKADALFSPRVENREDIIDFIKKISGARFVLTGSMHAAITAHAYGVPFALLKSEEVNCPPKWFDWMASIEMGPPVFVDNVKDGRDWYRSVRKD
jgi:hypothetical protein